MRKAVFNSKAREWRHDSDKQTGMADDFPKTVSKTAGVPKTHFETKTSPRSPLVLSEHAGVVWASLGI